MQLPDPGLVNFYRLAENRIVYLDAEIDESVLELQKMIFSWNLDADAMVIHTDDGERSIKTLLSDFNGAEIDFSIKVKSERDLDEPLDFIPEDAE